MINLYSFFGEMLILGLILICCLRVFFISRTRRDVLVLFAPLSFVLSLIQILAWGITIANITIFFLSIIAFLVNYRSLLSYNTRVVVDSYKTSFLVASGILLLITILFIAGELFFRPVMIPHEKYNVSVQNEFLSYNNSSLKETKDFRNPANFSIAKFTSTTQDNDIVIIVVPDLRAEKRSYIPYCTLLARSGYTVITGDIFNISNIKENSKTLRRAILSFESLTGKTKYSSSDIKISAYYKELYTALICYAEKHFPEKKLFFVTDELSVVSKRDLPEIFRVNHTPQKKNLGIMNLKNIPEYKTPGYGFISQTEPLFAFFAFGLSRDKTMFEPSYCVYLTVEAIKNIEKISGGEK